MARLLVPTSWASCRLGDAVDYGRTETVEPADIPADAWLLELKDIEKDSSRLLKLMTFRERLSKSTKNRFRAGDVLYGKLRPYLNKVLRVTRDGYCSTEIIPLKPTTAIQADYLFHWLKSPIFLAYVSEVSHGLNMPRLGTRAGHAAPLLLAPLNEQRRIAEKLNAALKRVNACRQRLDRFRAIIKHFRQSVLAAATSGGLTEDWNSKAGGSEVWPRVTLETVATGFSYGTAKKSARSGSVPVLRMGNIQDGRLNWADLVYTSDASEITKYHLRKGDVLFNRTNSPVLVGKTAVFRGGRNAIYAGYLIRVQCSESLMPDYLGYCLNSPAGKEYCRAVKSDGVSQSNINAKKLRAFTFALPTRLEQGEIVRRVESLFDYADRIETSYTAVLDSIERMMPALLAKAFRGKLVPQDPNDEPAAVLLRDIRTGRAATPTRARHRKAEPHADRSKKVEVAILDRAKVSPTHLSAILEKHGPLTAEALWSASQLEIDDFYDQLKDEEARGLLVEKHRDEPDELRLLEAVA